MVSPCSTALRCIMSRRSRDLCSIFLGKNLTVDRRSVTLHHRLLVCALVHLLTGSTVTVLYGGISNLEHRMRQWETLCVVRNSVGEEQLEL